MQDSMQIKNGQKILGGKEREEKATAYLNIKFFNKKWKTLKSSENLKNLYQSFPKQSMAQALEKFASG